MVSHDMFCACVWNYHLEKNKVVDGEIFANRLPDLFLFWHTFVITHVSYHFDLHVLLDRSQRERERERERRTISSIEYLFLWILFFWFLQDVLKFDQKFFGILNNQAKRITGPVPIWIIFLLNSSFLGKYLLHKNAITKTVVIHEAIPKIAIWIGNV